MENYENLLMDFYELTMGQAYFNKKVQNKVAYFDLFFRKCPDGASFVIANGVKKCVEFLSQFHFEPSDIEYLRSTGQFTEEYLQYLSTLKFTGDMWAVKDGTVVFPNEPMITVRAPLVEAQLVETALLLYFNHASLITTKANRIVRSAKGRAVMEFGTRRAQGESAAVDGAVYAVEAGACGTACTVAGKKHGVKTLGTMAHSFVQSFDSEFEAFKAYAESFPDNCVLLVDTYNTLKSGIPNAIKTHNEVLKPMGKKLAGIRIDSGDLAYLSKQARKMLDDAGIKDAKICTSNSLDENIIESLLAEGAPIDSFGVGENLITAKSNPVFGGVYKLVAVEKDGEVIPKIKISDNSEKIINPHFKKIVRYFDKDGKLITDVLYENNEVVPTGRLTLKHPTQSWTTKDIEGYSCLDIRDKMIENGKVIVPLPTIKQVSDNIQKELNTLWPEALRLQNPHTYTVNLSDNLAKTKQDLLNKAKEDNEKL